MEFNFFRRIRLLGDIMINFSALTRFTEQRLNTLCLNFERAYSKPDEETIHDLRVSLRRLLSHLNHLSFLYDQNEEVLKNVGLHHKKLKRYIKSLNQLRDSQIQIKHLESLIAPDECPESVLTHLRDDVKTKLDGLASEMDMWTLNKTRKKIRSILHNYPLPDRELELKSHLYLNYLTGRLHESVQFCQTPDICGCHKLRLRLKEYRYNLEMLEHGYGIKQILMGAVRQWQDDLGTLQDRRILLKHLDAMDWKNDADLNDFRTRIQAELGDLLKTVASEAHAIRYETQIK